MTTRLSELVAKWPTSFVAAHASGSIGSLETDLKARFGDKWRPITDKELQHACGLIHDAVHYKTLIHVGEPAIRVAVEGAREIDDGRRLAMDPQVVDG